MDRCIHNLWKWNCKPILGTITGRLALRLNSTPTWTPRQALAFIGEGAYPPEEMARIAKRAILNKG